MKGRSQRNTGETYQGISQPPRREDSHEKFRAAAAVATGELLSVITPPEVVADAPASVFGQSPFHFWILSAPFGPDEIRFVLVPHCVFFPLLSVLLLGNSLSMLY